MPTQESPIRSQYNFRRISNKSVSCKFCSLTNWRSGMLAIAANDEASERQRFLIPFHAWRFVRSVLLIAPLFVTTVWQIVTGPALTRSRNGCGFMMAVPTDDLFQLAAITAHRRAGQIGICNVSIPRSSHVNIRQRHTPCASGPWISRCWRARSVPGSACAAASCENAAV
jgi:hypothetical protein